MELMAALRITIRDVKSGEARRFPLGSRCVNFQFSHPHWLWLLLPAWAWIVWLTRTSDVQLGLRRRWFACGARLISVTAMLLALAGIQWQRPIEGLNVFFALDRSASVPTAQQDQILRWVNDVVRDKPLTDRAGALVFAADAAIEATPNVTFTLPAVQAVVPTERTDVGGAIRLATAAFPEAGQRRIVLLSDGNENLDDAIQAAVSARASGVSIDVVPLGAERDNQVSVRRLDVPSAVAKGQTFDVKVFVEAAQAGPANVQLYRDERFLGESAVQLEAGKNLFTFPQTLTEPGFYSYDVRLAAAGDTLPQDNRAFGFAWVRGLPRVLVVSTDPPADQVLADALRSAELDVKLTDLSGFPGSLAEFNSYDSVFFCNVGAGDLHRDQLRLLESAVRDFGVGFVCVGGPDTYAAGAYRRTPLETILPVDMELSSKKVLPPGALVLIIDRSGSMLGVKIEMARQAAMGAAQALADTDYIGVITFDGAPFVVAELQPGKNRKQIISDISRIDAGGGTAMYPPMERAFEMLKNARASLKHCIILTDGVSTAGDFAGLTRQMAEQRITVSTVGLGEDLNAQLLQEIADLGKGRFYYVPQPMTLPQIFIKETAIILKSAINEEPFTPQRVAATEPVRGLSAFPQLLGYVATEPKPRAEIPLVTEKGDPLLAHWHYGLGRTVAFTSDARNKWAQHWTSWGQYRQFWQQVARWSLRRLANADFVAAAAIEAGAGKITVEALDAQGDFQNYLTLQALVAGPGGAKQTVPLKQTAPGQYEADFPATEAGAYLLNVLQLENGQPVAQQVVGASLAASPELITSGANLPLLQRLAEVTGGRVLDPTGPASNPFFHERVKTYQSQELWEWLLRFVIIAFVLDVGVRRIQLEREEWQRAWRRLVSWLSFGARTAPAAPGSPSLASLLARRNEIRDQREVPSRLFAASAEPKVTQPAAPVVLPSPPPAATPEAEAAEVSTTSRLLDAKRRAQRRGTTGGSDSEK
jgi:Ca-activated chloride channel homolog